MGGGAWLLDGYGLIDSIQLDATSPKQQRFIILPRVRHRRQVSSVASRRCTQTFLTPDFTEIFTLNVRFFLLIFGSSGSARIVPPVLDFDRSHLRFVLRPHSKTLITLTLTSIPFGSFFAPPHLSRNHRFVLAFILNGAALVP